MAVKIQVMVLGTWQPTSLDGITSQNITTSSCFEWPKEQTSTDQNFGLQDVNVPFWQNTDSPN